MVEYLPRIGEKCYYVNREVIIMSIFDNFHLVKIKDLVDEQLLCVDKCALTREPDFTNIISLRLFGGKDK